MKIKEYALQKHLTQSAVYKAVQRAGYTVKELTDRNNDITAAGFAILAAIYPDSERPAQEPSSESPKESNPDNSIIDDLKARLSEAEKTIDKTETLLKAESEKSALFEKLYSETKEELRKLQESSERERSALHDRISEANRLLSQQQELARLATMNPIKRLFAGRKKKHDDAVESAGEVN